MECPVNKLAEQLDEKFGTWNLWRTAMGEWHISAKQGSQEFTETCPTITDALKGALHWRAIPLVPRERRIMSDELFEVCKNGSKWRLNYDGRDWGVQFDRKRDAEKYIAKRVELSVSEHRNWESMYGWTKNATEGVDFRYAN